MAKQFSLCIGSQKLQDLKKKRSNTVSHPATARWLSFFKKNRKIVRFYEQRLAEDGIFVVKKTEKIRHLGEVVIKITLEL